MKVRNKIIICLFIIAILLSAIVQCVIIPKNNQKNKIYMTQQQNPTTHDLDSVLKYKNKYIGNASNVVNLFNTLPLNNIKMSFELLGDNSIYIKYKNTIENINESQLNRDLLYNSTIAFALIDNLQAINYKVNDLNYKVLRSDVEKWYDVDLVKLLEKEQWRVKVQDKLKDTEYINQFTNYVLNKEVERK